MQNSELVCDVTAERYLDMRFDCGYSYHVVVATEWLVWMYGQWAIKCTVVALWSNMAVTSTRSPKGSQNVTALPCISTPHCSPTSQLLHSDLQKRREEKR